MRTLLAPAAFAALLLPGCRPHVRAVHPHHHHKEWVVVHGHVHGHGCGHVHRDGVWILVD